MNPSAMNSTVSVLIPTFNRGPMLDECLRSVLAQTVPAAQVIVVDDGSTDDTAERVARINAQNNARIQYLRKDNGGKARALNFAMPHVTGEYLWLFDDDDVALPNSIEMRLQALQARPDAGWVLTNHVWGKSGAAGTIEQSGTHQWPQVDDDNFFLTLMRGCFVTLQGALVRTACFATVGPFRDELINSQDYDMMLRLGAEYSAVLLDQPSFVFRQHEGLRGSAAKRYHGRDREKNFAAYDRLLGRMLRENVPLGMYLEPPLRRIGADGLTAPQQRSALLNRMSVMASKSMVAELFDDAQALVQLAQLARNGGAAALSASERATATLVTQQRYFVMALSSDPKVFLNCCATLAQTSTGRALLGQFGRGLASVAQWGADTLRQRLQLTAISLRLLLASWFGRFFGKALLAS